MKINMQGKWIELSEAAAPISRLYPGIELEEQKKKRYGLYQEGLSPISNGYQSLYTSRLNQICLTI
jgi:hypothetical protein